MTNKKDFYKKMRGMIKENPKPLAKETPKDLEKRVSLRICIFCNSAEIQMNREIENGLFVETFHCPDCKENWTTVLDSQKNGFTIYRHCINWVDHWHDLVNSYKS